MPVLNYYAVALCAVLSMVVGFIWYGPLFGRLWLEIIGANVKDIKARKEMQKAAGPLYLVQFLLSLFQVIVLATYISGLPQGEGLQQSLWIWAAFVMPICAGSAMWNNDSRKVACTRFLLQGGYQLILFVMFGLILTMWR